MLTDRTEFTNKKLSPIRDGIKSLIEAEYADYKDELCILTTGSFGRGEASEESDLDWYLVASKDSSLLKEKKESVVKSLEENLKALISNYVIKETGSTGTFGALIDENSLYQNYGGEHDTNQAFTRRMLYLLESRYLFNESLYNSIKEQIVSLYIKEDISKANINRFMLNDIIRYYRTICTDYEYKVNEKKKAWGLRKIKLRFSRKLIYFSGIITVAETCNMERAKKISTTIGLLEMTPLERIKYVAENKGVDSGDFIKSYCYFLDKISENKIREELDDVTRDNRHNSPVYLELKEKSNGFSKQMEEILSKLYTNDHPINSGLVF